MNKSIRIGIIAIAVITMFAITAAVVAYEPPVVTENTTYGLIIVDAGEWGEVFPYTPSAPTPQIITPAPTLTGPIPTFDACPSPEFTWLEVIIDRAPLREISGYNNKEKPVFTIYGKGDISARYVAKITKLLCAWRSPIQGDGGKYAFKLPSSQIVDGRWLPDNQYLYILTIHVVSFPRALAKAPQRTHSPVTPCNGVKGDLICSQPQN